MKHNTDYHIAKDCADLWAEKGEKYTGLVFYQLNKALSENQESKVIKLFLKCLRKRDKKLWHKFIDTGKMMEKENRKHEEVQISGKR